MGGTKMISAILLASGYGSRMKQPKLLLPVAGTPMIRCVAQAVQASRIDESVLIYREAAVREATADLVNRTIYNPRAHLGQSEAVKLGIKSLHPESHACFFVMGDQPMIGADVFNQLIQVFEKNPDKILVPAYQGKKGSPVLFPMQFWPLLLQLTGDQGGRTLLASLGESVVMVAVADAFAGKDVDTWEAYLALTEIMKREQP